MNPWIPNEENWFIAARSDQIKKEQKLARKIIGKHLVLFRSRSGKVSAMEDRCPHKNVPLSQGQVVGEEIKCLYHGWRFNSEGSCTEVPCHSPEEGLPECRVRTYEVVERDEWIWVYLGESSLSGPPPYPKTKGYYWFELHNAMTAPMDLILENGVDCSHTGILHRGLFRSDPTQFIKATIEETHQGIKVETFGEKKARSKYDIRSIAKNDEAFKHIDEFILPHTLKVDYWFGKSHVLTILVCTPEDDEVTRVYTRMAVSYPGFNWFMGPLIKLVTKIVVSQDRALLQAQAKCIKDFGGRSFHGTVQADLPASWLLRVFKLNNEKKFDPKSLRKKDVTYKL